MGLMDFFSSKKKKQQNNDCLDVVLNNSSIANALSKVIDPETGVDIVALGLIYDISINRSDIFIKMTMTTSSCPMVGLLMDLSKESIENLSGVSSVDIDLIWQPRWSSEMMSKDAKKQLGW